MTKYKEIFFLILVQVWLILACWRGLNQPLYWDSAYCLAPHSHRIANSLNPNHYTNYNLQNDNLLPNTLINTESDYPHTFGTALFYSFFYIMFPKNYLVVWHILSLVVSMGFLLVLYLLVKKISFKAAAISFLILMATNPIFLAQTTIVYHEIPGALFRYLSLYFLIINKNKLFLISSIMAFFIRFENGPILILSALAWHLFIKNWKLSFEELNKKSLSITILLSFIIIWFIFHKYLSGWTLISPLFGHTFDQKLALNTALSFLFIDQGRWLISLTILVTLIINFNQFIKNKRIIVLFLTSSLFLILTPLFLGTYLERYTISTFPVYYFFLVTGLNFNIKSKIIKIFSFITLIFLIIWQSQFLHTCSGNFETCLNVIEWIDLKKEIASYLEDNTEQEAVIYVNWDEASEYSEPQRLAGNFCQKCVNAVDYHENPRLNSLSLNQYIIIKNDNNYLIDTYSDKYDFDLVKIFGKTKLETKLFKLKPVN